MRIRVAALLCLIAVGGCARACGKSGDERRVEFDAEHTSSLASNTSDITFVVRTEGDRKRFAMGEKIPLVLRFSSTSPETHKIDIGTWDGSGRLESESLHFDRDTIVDPLEHYFEGGRIGGGARPSPPFLGAKPTEVTITLNEWARFVKPGAYRVYVASSRLESAARMTSDVIAFEIADDPKWAEAELARARAVLGTKESSEESANEARRSLRFLSTKEAARAMVDDLCAVETRSRFQTELGLYSSPFRRDVITMLEAGIAAPECAVTPSYLSTLTRISSGDGGLGVPEQKLLANLGKKTGPAIPITLLTALKIVDEHEQRDKKPDPMREDLRARIAPVFATLPAEDLSYMLERDWTKVRSAAMAPSLRQLVNEARPRGGNMRSISDFALERLLELDYDGARTFILAELGRMDGARVSFTGKTLGLLKDTERPELDAPLLAGLAAEQRDGATMELRSEVVARYASKAIVDKVWPLYHASTPFHLALLPYFWRNDRKAAEAEIRALEPYTVIGISDRMWNPLVEQIVIKQLKTRSARWAANALVQHGDASAEALLTARWREVHAAGPDKDKDRLAQDLWTGILRAPRWIITPEKARALMELCDDAMCKSDLSAIDSRWGADGKHPDLVLWSHTDGWMTGWFGHYDVKSLDDVKSRIDQLPAGYTIVLGTKPPDIDAAIHDKVRAWAAEKSIAVENRP